MNVYFFDGSKEAFLTALVAAFRDEEPLLVCGRQQMAMGANSVFVTADPAVAKRAEDRLLVYDSGCMRDLDLLLRSGYDGRGQSAFRYFRFLAQNRAPVRTMFAEPAVSEATELIAKVTTEVHRLHGFVRFMETAGGALYAPVNPYNDVCDLLAPHFRNRFRGIAFVIHDVARKKAAVCDGNHIFTAPLDRAEVVISAKENEWQKLWRTYYKSVNIPSRERLKQMRGYMPRRYWKNLTEFDWTSGPKG